MPKHSHSFEALGTQWGIETPAKLNKQTLLAIHDHIEAFDVAYSRFRNDSLVHEVSTHEGVFAFPHDAVKLFDFYRRLYELTHGKVTPLIGDMLERAGYDAHYTLVAKPQTPILSWDDVMRWNGEVLNTTQPVTLDVGAAGKGYLVDLLSELLEKEGILEYVIDASGDLRHKGSSPNRVGLEDPREPGKVIGAIDVINKSLCASAINRRAWGNGLHHIFDPDTMLPTKEIVATWVITDDTMTADGIATSLFFVEPEVMSDTYQFEYVRMHADGAIDYSPAFEGKLF